MATKNDVFPSNWLKAEDLDGDTPYTIKAIESSTLKDANGKEKLQRVLVFEETPKKMGLNKTNWQAISKVLNLEDDDDWVGHKITLYPTEVSMSGQTYLAIRVRLLVPKAPRKSSAQTNKAEEADSVPF